MSPLDCAHVRDLAPELALGVLDGEARAEALIHLDHCAACRTLVTELAEVGDAVVLVAPEADPPAGFEQRVLHAMTGADRRRRWRTVKLVAAVAAAAAIVSIVSVRVIDRNRPDSAPVAVAAPQSVDMVGANGQRVGTVEVHESGTGRALALTVAYALPDGEYDVVLDSTGSATKSLGRVVVTGGQGAWSGTAPAGPGDLVLVDASGNRLCSAKLPVA